MDSEVERTWHERSYARRDLARAAESEAAMWLIFLAGAAGRFTQSEVAARMARECPMAGD